MMRQRCTRQALKDAPVQPARVHTNTVPFSSFFGSRVSGPQLSAVFIMQAPAKYPGHPDFKAPPPAELDVEVGPASSYGCTTACMPSQGAKHQLFLMTQFRPSAGCASCVQPFSANHLLKFQRSPCLVGLGADFSTNAPRQMLSSGKQAPRWPAGGSDPVPRANQQKQPDAAIHYPDHRGGVCPLPTQPSHTWGCCCCCG